jgi:hypothetical protein
LGGVKVASQTIDIPPEERIFQMTFDALVAARACYAAAKLRIPDLLMDDSRTSDELAAASGTNPTALYRLLRCLASVGVVNEEQGRRFSLTALGAVLRSDAPGTMRPWVEFCGDPYYFAAWADILHSLRTGRAAFDHVHGKPFFDYLADHPEASRVFDEAMTSLTATLVTEVLAAYDFSGFQRVVDVGGGQGSLLQAILSINQVGTGVLFDVPAVIAQTAKLGLGPRCQLVSGDFFVELPAGGDAYVMKWILHDWDDSACDRILKNCRRAIAPNGKLLLIETVVPAPGVPHHSKLDDIEMMVLLGSQERTEDEYASLLGRSGFTLNRIAFTPTELVNIIEADPV